MPPGAISIRCATKKNSHRRVSTRQDYQLMRAIPDINTFPETLSHPLYCHEEVPPARQHSTKAPTHASRPQHQYTSQKSFTTAALPGDAFLIARHVQSYGGHPCLTKRLQCVHTRCADHAIPFQPLRSILLSVRFAPRPPSYPRRSISL